MLADSKYLDMHEYQLNLKQPKYLHNASIMLIFLEALDHA